ncbi:hypothetical protein SBADM41S_05049 [Streptomyces badius]
MVTKQFSGSPEDSDLRRADSLAREIFSDVANKWALLIIEALGEGTLRFSELRGEVEGIGAMLAQEHLRMLERYGLVSGACTPPCRRGSGTRSPRRARDCAGRSM